MKFLLSKKFLIPLLLLIGVFFFYRSNRPGATETKLKTTPITRGDITVSISATGTVEPEEVIDVGAQVAGLILSFGTDKNGKPVDYGSEVDEGTVLAEIDDTLYAADVSTAEAQLKKAKADVATARARLAQAERDWGRAQKLQNSEAMSPASFDGYRAAHETAQAALLVAESGVAQADAALTKALRNLGFCTITSPVKGVIIDRRVNIGQTVVSSLNAPSLFLLAKDLRHMQVWVSVNEADIGKVTVGQKVEFTVDAFPGQVFHGEVGKIRLNAAMTQNVVTYTVEVKTDNSSLKLLPYLTANTKFIVSEHQGALLVPNAALRWTPPADLIETQKGEGKEERKASSADKGVLWVPAGSKVRPKNVDILGTDGVMTAVRGEIEEGNLVVTGVEARSASSGTTNPFAPQPMRGGRRG